MKLFLDILEMPYGMLGDSKPFVLIVKVKTNIVLLVLGRPYR